jgi:hypothetical protein
MAKRRPEIEWAPADPRAWRRMGMRQRVDDRWEVITGALWWNEDERELVAVVDSRDAAIGFIKLLKEN